MDKTDKYIDNLFRQKFSVTGVSVPPSVTDWSQLNKVIRKKNFMRFAPGSFNVYYLSAIVGTVTTVGSFILPDIIRNDKRETENNNTTIQITDTLTQKDYTLKNPDSTFRLKLELQKANCAKTKTKLQLIMNEPSQSDTIQNTEDDPERVNQIEKIDSLGKDKIGNSSENGDNTVENQLINKIAPADTIVKIDTLRIQKKGIQFKRKKEAF